MSYLKPTSQVKQPVIRSGQTQKPKYVTFKRDTIAEINNDIIQGKLDKCTRQVFDFRQKNNQPSADNLFVDRQFTINASSIPVEKNKKIIVKRLSTLYSNSNKYELFPKNSQPTRPKNDENVPNCIKQLAVFDMLNYKNLFLTENDKNYGQYDLYFNNAGRFEIISVDDRIPIYQDTLQPIWGLTYKNPWELILIKAYAKKVGGYDKLWQTNPFNFIESVSNPTWKYFNLQKQGKYFLQNYYKNFGQNLKQHAFVVLKTKRIQQQQTGLLSNSACYILQSLGKHTVNGKEEHFAVVTATPLVNWTGTLNYASQSISKAVNFNNSKANLNHQFIITQSQAVNYFASAYVTSHRENNFYSGHGELRIPAGHKKAVYIQFTIPSEAKKDNKLNAEQTEPKPEMFDLSIRQSSQNITKNQGNSKVNISTIKQPNKRYLKTKYILVKDLKNSEGKDYKSSHQLKSSNIQGSKINGVQHDRSKFPKIQYEPYEIDYRKGYNQGDSLFLRLDPGKYILRFKSQTVAQEAFYTINWVSAHNIKVLIDTTIQKKEQLRILQDAFSSKCWSHTHTYIDNKKPTEMTCAAQSFDKYGYGFIGVSVASDSDKVVRMTFDPAILRKNGYILKGEWKDRVQAVDNNIAPGQYKTIVLKRTKEVNNNAVWPSIGINFEKGKAQSLIAASNVSNAQKQPGNSNAGKSNFSLVPETLE